MLPDSWWDSACRCRSGRVVNLSTEAISCGPEPGGVLVGICCLMDNFFYFKYTNIMEETGQIM